MAETAEVAALRDGIEASLAKWTGCWCGTQLDGEHDSRVRDCPQHGDDSCRHQAAGIAIDLRHLLESPRQ